MAFAYPADLFDEPAKLLLKFGSFWHDVYDDRELLEALCAGISAGVREAADRLVEAEDCLSVATVPPFSRRRWLPVKVLRSALRNEGVAGYLDDPLAGTLGAANPPVLDGQAAPAWRLPVPSLVYAPAVTNRVSDPSLVLHLGTDFVIEEPGVLRFLEDPTESGLFETTLTADGDVEYLFWLWRPAFDKEYVWRHYGYVLGLRGVSGEEYRKAVEGAWRATANGTSFADVARAWAGATGSQLATATATVEDVSEDDRGLVVVTSAEVLRYPLGSTAAVAVGGTLRPGDSGAQEVGFAELRSGVVPSGVRVLILNGDLLRIPTRGGLVFENVDLPLTEDDGDYTFPIGGLADDVALFWAAVRQREASTGVGLADLVTHVYGYVPAAVNPARLLAAVLRNAYVGYSSGPGPKVATSQVLRAVLPPHAALLSIAQLPVMLDSGTVGSDSAGALTIGNPMADTGAWAGATATPAAFAPCG